MPELWRCLLSDEAKEVDDEYLQLLIPEMRKLAAARKPLRSKALLESASLLRDVFEQGQQDASEFLAALMQRVAAEPCMDTWKELLRRQEAHNMLCLACDAAWIVREREPELLLVTSLRQMSSPVALLECMTSYSAPSVPANFRCRSCQSESTTSKSIEVKQAPDILCVVLKRMTFIESRSRKISTPVAVPLSLHYSGRGYELNALIVHRGVSTNSGHYVTLGKR